MGGGGNRRGGAVEAAGMTGAGRGGMGDSGWWVASKRRISPFGTWEAEGRVGMWRDLFVDSGLFPSEVGGKIIREGWWDSGVLLTLISSICVLLN